MAETYLLVMKADDPLEERRQTELPTGEEPPNEMSTPQKVEADFPEPDIQDEEAWQKERKIQRWHNFETP
jgi:hypothetical protein